MLVELCKGEDKYQQYYSFTFMMKGNDDDNISNKTN